MSNNEKKDKGIAIAGTIVVHALVVLVLFFMAFKAPEPPGGEEGVEVNLGMMDQGMGDIQPEKSAAMQAAQPQQQIQQNSQEENLTQDNEEAPAIEEKKEKKQEQQKKPVEQPKKEVAKKQEVNQKSMFKYNENGGSEGETGQPGDQGDPNGSIKSLDHGKGGKGGGEGTGPGGHGAGATAHLGNRKAISLPRPSVDDTEQEVIKVGIKVNKKGLVVDQWIADGYKTTTSTANQRKALEAAKKATFEADENALDEQIGSITYTFTY